MTEGREHLSTEQSLAASAELDQLELDDALALFTTEDHKVVDAVAAARPAITAAIELVSRSFADGGRLFYVGAGTSGRLGVLDASECPPTFQTEPDLIQAVIAGGDQAITRSVEGAEDARRAGALQMHVRGVKAGDVVFGITAGGTTPYVLAALAAAKELGAATVFFACVPKEQAPDEADVSIRVLTGPEILTGSTRLKAGTATKLVLNMVSTMSLVRCGKVFGNLMVDVRAFANDKLRDRGERILMQILGVERAIASELLEAADGQVKLAALMYLAGLDRDAASARLERVDGHLRKALD